MAKPEATNKIEEPPDYRPLAKEVKEAAERYSSSLGHNERARFASLLSRIQKLAAALSAKA